MDSKEEASCRRSVVTRFRGETETRTKHSKTPFPSFFFFLLAYQRATSKGRAVKTATIKALGESLPCDFLWWKNGHDRWIPRLEKKATVTLLYIYILSKLTGPLVSLWNRHIILPLFAVAWIWNEITSDSLFFLKLF